MTLTSTSLQPERLRQIKSSHKRENWTFEFVKRERLMTDRNRIRNKPIEHSKIVIELGPSDRFLNTINKTTTERCIHDTER